MRRDVGRFPRNQSGARGQQQTRAAQGVCQGVCRRAGASLSLRSGQSPHPLGLRGGAPEISSFLYRRRPEPLLLPKVPLPGLFVLIVHHLRMRHCGRNRASRPSACSTGIAGGSRGSIEAGSTGAGSSGAGSLDKALASDRGAADFDGSEDAG